jgi:erythromycin esterase
LLQFLRKDTIIKTRFYLFHVPNAISYARDSVMAANFVWLSKTYPNSKFILWAHSEHLKRSANKYGMGYWLNKTMGDRYANISFCTANGTYTTWGSKTVGQPEIVDLTQPENNNLEYYFMQAKADNFFLFKKNKEYPDVFDQGLSMRDLGVGGDPQNTKGNKFRSYGAWNAFDGFVFIKNTKATEHFLLKK